MGIFEGIGIGILVALVGLALIYLRRGVISRAGGTIDMNMRLSTLVRGRGWAPGLGRLLDDELRWYRVFSFSLRPRRVLSRYGLIAERRRSPEGAERLAMPPDWVVVRCVRRCGDATQFVVDLALAESALNGFLSWLESAPPGALRQP